MELLVRQGSLAEALSMVEEIAASLEDQHGDVYHRVRVLILKANLLDKIGRPHKGFSIAVRAASIAWRARLLPSLWHAMQAIAVILVHLRESDAAVRVLTSIIPQVGYLFSMAETGCRITRDTR